MLFAILITGFLIIGHSPSAFGAQLITYINPDEPSSEFEMKYQRTIVIEYEEGGQIADALRAQKGEIAFVVDSTNSAVAELQSRLNQAIVDAGSATQVNNLMVDYTATLTGRGLNTSVDLKLVLTGDLVGYTIRERQGQTPSLVDMGWRGMTVQGDVNIEGHEINQPINILRELSPSVASAMAGSEAEQVLMRPLIDADGIKNQPLGNWHFLFDPTGINVDAAQFGISQEIAGFVVSGFTMGESSIREGRQIEQEIEGTFTTDKTYTIRAVQSADNANIHVIGFAVIDNLEGLEIVGVTPRAPEGFATTATGGFPVMIIYGMAAMAVIGGGAFFFFSNRSLKKQEGMQGQTGIDPSRLRAYETSAGAGGYQTVRGEAQLIDDEDYQKTRSVYDEQGSQQQQESPPPALESTSEATCGCATSAEMGSECDCAMQGSCLCDSTCTCGAEICREQVQSMS